jgi:hypothetical protein
MIGTTSLRWVDEYVLSVTTAAGVREERLRATPAYLREIEAFEREARASLPTSRRVKTESESSQ